MNKTAIILILTALLLPKLSLAWNWETTAGKEADLNAMDERWEEQIGEMKAYRTSPESDQQAVEQRSAENTRAFVMPTQIARETYQVKASVVALKPKPTKRMIIPRWKEIINYCPAR